MPHVKFSKEQVEILRQNPYTLKVNEDRILFTYEFKQFFMREIVKKQMTAPKVFRLAGYDVKLLGRSRIDAWNRKIKKEAASPEGLKMPKWSREAELDAFAKMDLTKKQQLTILKEMQARIVYLEQEIELLKKIYQIESMEGSSE